MSKKLLRKKANLKGFLVDLIKIDKKLLMLLILCFLLSFFIYEKPLKGNEGSVFGIKTNLFESPVIYSDPFVFPTPALYPKKTSDVYPPATTALSAIVMDSDSQVVLYEKNDTMELPPASVTKIMTALTGMEYFASDDILVVPPALVTEGSKMGLLENEQITFENILYGLLLNSGNDAAEVIAKNSPVGLAGFIEHMNKRAKELHLVHTHFQNVSGLESENHYTSALDLARLATVALKNKQFAKVVSTKEKTVTDVSGAIVHKLENLNKLLGNVEGVEGVKTGFTEEAGQVLIIAATRHMHTIVVVVLKSEDRFLDSQNLLEWAFATHEFTSVF